MDTEGLWLLDLAQNEWGCSTERILLALVAVKASNITK